MRATNRCAILALLIIAVAVRVVAPTANPWKAWLVEVRRRCPANHLDWIGGSAYDDLIGYFVRAPPRGMQQKIDVAAGYSPRCSTVTIGFACEEPVYMDAFEKLEMLPRFAASACRRNKC